MGAAADNYKCARILCKQATVNVRTNCVSKPARLRLYRLLGLTKSRPHDRTVWKTAQPDYTLFVAAIAF